MQLTRFVAYKLFLNIHPTQACQDIRTKHPVDAVLPNQQKSRNRHQNRCVLAAPGLPVSQAAQTDIAGALAIFWAWFLPKRRAPRARITPQTRCVCTFLQILCAGKQSSCDWLLVCACASARARTPAHALQPASASAGCEALGLHKHCLMRNELRRMPLPTCFSRLVLELLGMGGSGRLPVARSPCR